MKNIVISNSIFDFVKNRITDKINYICITTNGVVKANGENVMGAGIAKECATLYPDIPKKLGNLIKSKGNQVYDLGQYGNVGILSVPTKDNWKQPSDIKLIEKSMHEINKFYEKNKNKIDKIYFIPFGIGCGKLDEKTMIKKINYFYKNNDNFIMIIRKPKDFIIELKNGTKKDYLNFLNSLV